MNQVFNRPTLSPVTVCGRKLPYATHICAFFDSDQQEYDCLVPYFAEGLAQGEQVVTIRDADKLSSHRAQLQDRMATPIGDAMNTDQFRFLASEETYVQDGFFGHERMGLMLEEVLKAAERGPFGRVRTCGDASLIRFVTGLAFWSIGSK